MGFNFSKDDYGGVKNTGLEKADLLMELMMARFGSAAEIETKLEFFYLTFYLRNRILILQKTFLDML